jgi:hypothetical protein
VLRSKVQRRRGTPATNDVPWGVPPHTRGRKRRSSLHVRANLVARASPDRFVDPVAESAFAGPASLGIRKRPHSRSRTGDESPGGCRAVRVQHVSPAPPRRAAGTRRPPATGRTPGSRRHPAGLFRTVLGPKGVSIDRAKPGHRSRRVRKSTGTGLSLPSNRFFFHKT